MNLKDKTALPTDSSKGIGRTVTLHLAQKAVPTSSSTMCVTLPGLKAGPFGNDHRCRERDRVLGQR